jgi:hypothetical protein
MGTVAIIGIVALAVYVGFMLFRLAESWSLAVEQDALSVLDDEAHELQDLAVAKARVLRDIKDLEFDYQTGHLTEDDYNGLRQKLERKAIAILKRLDALRGDVDYDALIDAEMERRYGANAEPSPAKAKLSEVKRTQAELAQAQPAAAKAGAAKAGAAKAAKANGAARNGAAQGEEACGACGHHQAPGARFCSQCGASMAPPAPKFCHACGHGLEPGAKFCASCGARVRAEHAAHTTRPPEQVAEG